MLQKDPGAFLSSPWHAFTLALPRSRRSLIHALLEGKEDPENHIMTRNGANGTKAGVL